MIQNASTKKNDNGVHSKNLMVSAFNCVALTNIRVSLHEHKGVASFSVKEGDICIPTSLEELLQECLDEYIEEFQEESPEESQESEGMPGERERP